MAFLRKSSKRPQLEGLLACLFELDSESFGHSIKGPAVNAHYLGRASPAASYGLQHMNQISTLEFVERRKISEHQFDPFSLHRANVFSNLFRQVIRANGAAACVERSVFNGVLEFAHVARPIVLLQKLQGFFGESRRTRSRGRGSFQ